MGLATHPDLTNGVPPQPPARGSLPVSNPPKRVSHTPEKHPLGPEPAACHPSFKETLNPFSQNKFPKREEEH